MVDKKMVNAIRGYLRTATGVEVAVSDVRGRLRLTPMVASLYDFALCCAESVRFALLIERDDAIVKPTPAAIEGHIGLVSKQLDGLPVVYAAKRIVSYNRLRLLARRVPFIVPGRQLYLPFLNMVLTEVGEKKPKVYSGLGVAAQMILLGYLNRSHDGIAIADAAALTGYTRISVMKAYDELEYFGLAMRDHSSHRLVFGGDRRKLFESAKPLLRNPKRRTLFLDAIPNGLAVVKAGVDALSDISMLAPGSNREFAVLSSEALKRKDLVEVPRESASVQLELWHYRPAFVYGDRIDPLSLVLSLSDDGDDRVQGELEEVLEKFKW